MNEHLQNILSIIQRAEHLSVEEKTALLKEAKATDKELEITAFKLERTEKVKHTTAVLLEETIEELEQKRKAVEAQNKELEIEAALEKVRSRSLAMHKSDELGEVIQVIYDQLNHLEFEIDDMGFLMDYRQSNDYNLWIANTNGGFLTQLNIPYFDHPFTSDYIEQKDKGLELFANTYSFEEKNRWWEIIFKSIIGPEEIKEALLEIRLSSPGLALSRVFTKNIGIYLLKFSGISYSEIENAIIMRFAKVFEQTYTRFLDLQKAEAQTREVQIQLSLERVRARAMAMYHSDELSDVLSVLFQQYDLLGISPVFALISLFDLDKNTITTVTTGIGGQRIIAEQTVALNAMDVWQDSIEEWKKNESNSVSCIYYPVEIVPQLFELFRDLRSAIPGELRAQPEHFPDGMFQTMVNCKFGTIGFAHYRQATDQEKEISIRCAKEFERLYQRFLDLQKAEAHAREAQIELGLERVRARAMAMHGSDELKELVKTLFEELIRVDVDLSACLISTFDISTLDERSWMFHPITREPYVIRVPYNEQSFYHEMLRAWKERNTAWNYCLKGEIKVKWHDFLFADTEFALLPQSVIDEMRRPDKVFFTASYYSYGAIQVASLEPFPAQSIDIIQRFSKVFDLSYTRFLDLQKAEEQARESQIELALERIRARTMAMQHSDELSETASLLFEQVQSFGVALWSCGFNISEKGEKECTSFITRGGKMLPPVKVPLTENSSMQLIYEFRERGVDFWYKEMADEEIKELFSYIARQRNKNNPGDNQFLTGVTLPAFQIAHFVNFSHGNLMFITLEAHPEMHDIFKRFGKVFQQTYTRFLDLLKAEAQAREGQIELALERVRARTMAMQRSDELREAVLVIYEQLQQLNFESKACNIIIIDKESGSAQYWVSGFSQEVFPESYTVPYLNHPYQDELLKPWKRGDKYVVYRYTGKMKQSFDEIFFTKTEFRNVPEDAKKVMIGLESVVLSTAFISCGALQALGAEPLSEEDANILRRFAKVFEQTYTRFLDLQKAEAQARESQIQLALERVRARTMAMQKSDELAEVASLLFKQVSDLGVNAFASGFQIWQEDDISTTTWGNAGGNILPPFRVPHTEEPFHRQIYEARQRGKDFFVMETAGKELEDSYRYLRSLPGVKEIIGSVEDSGSLLPKFQVTHCAFFSQGYIMFITAEPAPAAHDIFKRFAKVFEQTYTRFLDLQKAEAQARESQIQLALERVRARTMAMQKSDELPDAASLLFKQITDLGIKLWSTGFQIWNADDISTTAWPSAPDGSIQAPFRLPYNEDIFFKKIYEARQSGKDFFVMESSGKELEETYHYMFNLPGVKKYFDDALDSGFAIPKFQITHCAFFAQGYVMFITYEPVPEAHDIFKRFAKVFEQTYTRFLDLQKAEAQARESQIQLALERVRARTMAMQRSEELPDAALLLSNQVKELGVQLWGTSFQLWDEYRKEITVWSCIRDIMILPFKVPATEDPLYINILEAARKGEALYVEELSEEVLENHTKYMMSIPGFREGIVNVFDQGFILPASLMYNAAYFSNGFILFITLDPCPESHEIFKRFGKVFEQTYTRFLDLQKAEAQAREAKIEAALERVRGRAMAMHRSEELKDVANELRKQLASLGQKELETTAIHLYEESPDYFQSWAALLSPNTQGEVIQTSSQFPKHGVKIIEEMMQCYNLNKKDYVLINEGVKAWEFIEMIRQYAPKVFEVVSTSLKGIAPEDIKAYWSLADFTGGSLVMTTMIEPDDTSRILLRRFANVFGLAYRRFVDLKLAEEQAREAQIQLALERVRARTMAMQKSNELAEAARVLYEEFRTLNINTFLCGYCFYKEEQDKQTVWVTLPDGSLIPDFMDFPVTGDHVLNKRYEDWKQKKPLHVLEIQGEENKEHHRFLASKVSDQTANEIFAQVPDRIIAYCANFSTGYLFIIATEFLTDEEEDVIIRFAKVFELTYTRFSDLKQAEEQARESQIQLALERVRARTMAMQKSEELQDAAALLFQQINSLGAAPWSCGFNIYDDDRKTATSWMGSELLKDNGSSFKTPTDEHIFKIIYEAFQRSESLYIHEIKSGEIEAHYRYMFTLPGAGDRLKAFVASGGVLPAIQILHAAFFAQGYLMFITQEPVPEIHDIFKRFAKVFEQTYTRFLDLQKAEAQARESQIQLALERVRARTMAMQRSDELGDAASLLFKQIADLGTRQWSSGFDIWNANEVSAVAWMSNPDGSMGKPFNVPYTEDPFFKKIYEARQSGEDFFVMESSGKELEETYQYLFNLPEAKKHFDGVESLGFQMPTFQITHCAFFSHGYLMFITFEAAPEMWDIFKRFAKVFEQTYTRFLDLQTAEAQARESQIEAALERVRSRSMGMQKSEELREIIQVIYEQFIHLGFKIDSAGFATDYLDNDDFNFWFADAYSTYPNKVHIPYFDHPQFNRFKEAKEKGRDFYASNLTFEEKNKFFEHVIKNSTSIPEEFKEIVFTAPGYISSHVILKNIVLYILNYTDIPFLGEENAILMRFGKVFQQTYTRFLDLQNAEAQALEAVKRASVDRVRAEIASMRTTNDLERITPLVWNELTTLGVPFIRCGVFIMDEAQQTVQSHLSTPDGKATAGFRLHYYATEQSTLIVTNWQQKKIFNYHMDEAAFAEYTKNLLEQGAITSGEKYLTENRPTDLYLHFLPFLQGMLYVGNTEPLSDDALQLAQNLADAFSTAYARYEDFNKLESAKVQIEKTLVDLKQTQAQLVQSEKMASLGELTAGIAHEIQNPLNFVNNFSEVSNELIEEMNDELDKGDIQEAKAIAAYIQQNLEKINHHGKRADAIVKGMLQHSRSSSATKEPTDINKLADEYLRLAYHGLRAKDKSFNATMVTDYDETTGNVNIIPQDIGRVILNLIMNAFYTVAEKKKQANNNYEPTVSVTTKKINEAVEIKVADNGNGIPQKVLDKIFQPFFTTKPTGQGTGLGLSLAYDIIKTHGGEIKVETKDNEGSVFTIQLPVKDVI